MTESASPLGALPLFASRIRRFTPGTDVGLAIGVVALLSVLILPLPTILLDFGLALSITAAVLRPMPGRSVRRPRAARSASVSATKTKRSAAWPTASPKTSAEDLT